MSTKTEKEPHRRKIKAAFEQAESINVIPKMMPHTGRESSRCAYLRQAV